MTEPHEQPTITSQASADNTKVRALKPENLFFGASRRQVVPVSRMTALQGLARARSAGPLGMRPAGGVEGLDEHSQVGWHYKRTTSRSG